MEKQAVIKIYGRVQAVLFRDSARRQANKLGLTGWVKNEPDGTVKIIAEGPEEGLKDLIDWCYNGPILARVERVEVEWREATGQFDKFEINLK